MRVLFFITATLLVAASLASVNAFSLPNTLKPAATPVTKSSAGDRLVFSGGGARSMIAGLVFNEELASATRFVAPLAQTEGLSGGGWSVLVNEALGPKEALTRLRAWVAKGNEIGGSFKGIPEVLLHSLWHAYGAWIEQQRDTIAAPLSTETTPFAYNEKGQSHVLVGASLSAYQGATATVDTTPQSALLQASKSSGGWDSCILDMRGQSGSLQCGSAPALKVTKNGARVSFAQPYAVSMRGAHRLVEQDDEKEKGAKPKALDDCIAAAKNKERPLVPTKRSDAMKLDRAQQGAFGSLAFLATRLSSSGGCSGLPVEFEVTGTKAVALPVSLELWDLGLRCNIPVTPTDMVTPGVSFAVDASDDKNLFDATRTCVDYWNENFNYQVIDVTESTTTIPWFGLHVNLKSMGALKDYVKVFSFTRAGKSTGRRLVVLTLGNFDPCTGALVDSSKRYNAIHTVTFLKNPNAFDGKRFRLLDVNVRKFLRTALGALFKGAVAVDKLPIDAAECAKYGEDWPANNDPNSEENKGPVGPRSGSA